jgi:hypothetical protein
MSHSARGIEPDGLIESSARIFDAAGGEQNQTVSVAANRILASVDPGSRISGSFVISRNTALTYRKPLGPEMRVGLGIDQLDVDADLVARSTDAPFEHIADAQLAADLLRVDRLVRLHTP